jgi:uncharacterized damage-inducible protein DinB
MENEIIQTNELTSTEVIISSQDLQEHWQGHRRLTRKVIEAFPEDKLFEYSIGGMRPFSELVLEVLEIAELGVKGVATGDWGRLSHENDTSKEYKTKQDLLNYWDRVTKDIDSYWPQIRPRRFQEVEAAFGLYEGPIYSTIFYFIDNEIHHRGQGYVYLRSLGIAPPPFWER